MGLDFIVNTYVVDKKKDEIIKRYEIAYWRKAYAIRDAFMKLAGNDDYWHKDYMEVESNDDYLRTCTPDVVDAFIDELCGALTDTASVFWHDTVFVYHNRATAAENLKTLCNFSDAYRESLKHLDDIDTPTTIPDDTDEFEMEEVLAIAFSNPDKYDVFVEVVNSY